MNKSSEITALLRRSSKSSQDRVLFICYCLLESQGGECASEHNTHGGLSLASVCTLLKYAFPGVSPRFLFALGSNSMLLRSPDRGVTWKTVFSPHSAPPKGHIENGENGENDGAVLDQITDILQTKRETSADLRDGNVLWLVCQGDTVVFGGKKGIIGVSGDKGVSFTLSEDDLSGHVGKGAKLSHAALLDATHLVVSCDAKVILVDLLAGTDRNTLTVSAASRVLLTCRQNVCMLQAQQRGATCEIVVAEPSILYYSPDSGNHFVEFEHSLGFIRDVDFLASTRRTCLPRFPSEARVLADVKTKAVKSATVGYEYAVGVKKSLNANTIGDVWLGVERYFSSAGPAACTMYRHLFVCGVGTEVLPYDYSAMLCVCLRRSGEELSAYTIGSNVSYVPYTRSGPGEALLCASGTVPESDKPTYMRGNTCGVSFSGDGVKWSDPKKSSPVSIIPCDGGDVIVCGQRNTVTTFGCKATATWPIPRELRIPALVSVVPLQ